MGFLKHVLELPSQNEIKGLTGEFLTKFYSHMRYDAEILQDVLIDGAEGYTSQIDLLMIGHKGIYVIEVKHFSEAKIYGDGKKDTWYYYLNNKKYNIYSPLKQNQKHICYLKKFLDEFGDVPFFSILVIICKDFKVTNINKDPEKIDTVVCSSLPAMERGIKLIIKNHDDVIDDVEIQKISQHIKDYQYKSKEKRSEHKANVTRYQQEQASLKKEKICPKCKTKLVLREGKYGQFYGCVNYPRCRFTMPLK